MEIESVEWSKYNLSFEGIIEAWIVAGDMLAVVSALMKVQAATEEDMAKLMKSLKP
ncbi:MAG: hypothetical protein JSW28_06600 [Thermoplasmata archaeon]|nr:MAG: hypothetical protein JSW28_06600 [Thermoplasmata archaeon]